MTTPRRRNPRRPDSSSHPSRDYPDYTVSCQDCPKVWRFGCKECAEHHVEYHQGAFDGHRVEMRIRDHRDRDEDWSRQRPQRIQALFGRRNI